MRTKEQIRQQILDNLSLSANWQDLQHGLVGKELLAWATEVVYAQESVAQTMVDSLDYQKATEESLISLCHINDVHTTFNQPGLIRVKIKDAPTPIVYPPFSIKAVNGSAAFYNVGYCQSGDTIIMYQGTPIQYNNTSYLAPFIGDVTNLPPLEQIDDCKCYPIDLIPDSVYVFQLKTLVGQSFTWQAMSLYTPVNYDENIVSFKHYIKEDKTNVVMLGNAQPDLGIHGWGKFPEGEVAICGIRPAFTKVTSNQYRIFFEDVESTDFTFISYYPGEENSLEYAKQYYRQKLLSTTVIQSATQIKDYVNAFPYVQDCAIDVVVADRTRIHIYIKPKDSSEVSQESISRGAGNVNFGEIELALDMHGAILSNYYATYGTPVEYNINIYTPEGTTQQVKNSIAVGVGTHLSYENTPYNYRPSVAEVAAFIQANYQVNCLVLFSITEQLRSRLSFVPTRGTMKFYDSASDSTNNPNAYQAWDSDGIIYSAGAVTKFMPTFSLGLGRSLTNFTVCLGGLLHQFAVDSDGEFVADKYLFGVDGVTAQQLAPTGDGYVRRMPTITNYSDVDTIINSEGIFAEIGQSKAASIAEAIAKTDLWKNVGLPDDQRSGEGFLTVEPREMVTNDLSFSFYLMSDQSDDVNNTPRSYDRGSLREVDEDYGFKQNMVIAERVLKDAKWKDIDTNNSLEIQSSVYDKVLKYGYRAIWRRSFVIDTNSWFATRQGTRISAETIRDVDKSIRLVSTNGYDIFLVANINDFEDSYSKRLIVCDNSIFWNYPNVKPTFDTVLATFELTRDFPYDFSKPNFDASTLYESTPQDYAPLLLYHRKDPNETLDAHTLIWVTKGADKSVSVHYGAMSGNNFDEKFVYPLEITGNPIAAFVKRNNLSEDLIVFVTSGAVTKAVLVADYMAPTIHQKTLTISNLADIKELFTSELGNIPALGPQSVSISGIFRGCESRLTLKLTNMASSQNKKYEIHLTASDFTYSEKESSLTFENVMNMEKNLDGRDGLAPITSPFVVSAQATCYKYFPLPLYDRKNFSNGSDDSSNITKGNGSLNRESRDFINQYSQAEHDNLNTVGAMWTMPILVTNNMIVIGVVRYGAADTSYGTGSIFCKTVNKNGKVAYNLLNPVYVVYKATSGGRRWTRDIIIPSLFNVFKELSMVGTIDYFTGDLRTAASLTSSYVKYESSSYANLTPKYFFKLKDTPNVQSLN